VTVIKVKVQQQYKLPYLVFQDISIRQYWFRPCYMHTARVGCISSQYRSCSWSCKIPEKVRLLYNLHQINNFQ